jgi:hypothetical protein
VTSVGICWELVLGLAGRPHTDALTVFHRRVAEG